MPSQLPTSFASAAAANGASDGNTNGRSASRGDGGDWSRTRTNGATQTFRRPSIASTNSYQREAIPTNSSGGLYVPPHLNSNHQPTYSRIIAASDLRYSKDELLDLFRTHGQSANSKKNLSDLFVEGWNPGTAQNLSNGFWGRRDENKDAGSGPEICWDSEGATQPIGLTDFSEDELEIFSSSVNSPLKPPPQNPKEGQITGGLIGRKSSISQIQGLAQANNSTPGRPGTRRRETSDSLSSTNPLTSPGLYRAVRDDPQSSTPPVPLVRRRTDLKDSPFASGFGDKTKPNEKLDNAPEASSPFGSFRRNLTGPMSAGLNGPSSPWSATPQSAGFPQMGAFGSFALGAAQAQPPTPGDKKVAIGGLRGESRFKGLMGKDSSEDISRLNNKASVGSLERLAETEAERQSSLWGADQASRVQATERIAARNEEDLVGSAALGGDVSSPPAQALFRPASGERPKLHDDIGFSAFETSSDMPTFREMMQRREYSQQQTPQNNQYGSGHPHEPMSPTSTNPYQSPEGDNSAQDNGDHDGSETLNPHHNMPGYSSRPLNMSFEGAVSDRSQTSSAGPVRGLPNLGGLGGFGSIGNTGPWSTAPGVAATPSRANPGFASPFGDSIFGPLGDLHTPGSAAVGTAGNLGTIGRGSKMGSLFPAAMQDQMRGNDQTKSDQGFGDGRVPSSVDTAGFEVSVRDVESPSRQGRGVLDELFGGLERGTRQNMTSPFGTIDSTQNTFGQGLSMISSQAPFTTTSHLGGTPSATATSTSSLFGRTPETDTSNQMPATQQRQMVMPDRMRWIYRDPQGNTQGPWSGLEMHDWYKAGFFSPELQVKKLEDADYEPLAQLIRRIGNSREPFLVPQIGIPHGSASTQASGSSALLGSLPVTSPGAQSGSAQPPFAGSFPSFGTTLTAEQQNALERRKQEEQYLMARQKEHLAQQQVMIKQMQHMQGGPHSIHAGQLHHHSSAHSLQSQPSYGSITSPSGYQHSPAQGPLQQPPIIPGFFDSQMRPAGQGIGPIGYIPEGLPHGRDSETVTAMDHLKLGRGTQPAFGSPQIPMQQEGLSHKQQVEAMLQDRARLQREQEQFEVQQGHYPEDIQVSRERYDHFKQLREQDNEPQALFSQPATQPARSQNQGFLENQTQGLPPLAGTSEHTPSETAQLSSEVGKTPTAPTQSPWAAIDTSLPQPFPPPQSMSPLPAPSAQRSRHNVAEAFTVESRSRSQTPSIDTPSATVAPWAKENLEGSRGPSLKEIQETEARETAQQDEIAAAARRALVEQERQNQTQIASPAPGLPSSANWASSTSPATPTSAGLSAWAKPLAGKRTVATPATSAKKTLAQIQKEEEARKNRAAAAAAANAVNTLVGGPSLAGGKRYADLAGKIASPSNAGVGGAWTTVGAGGKLKGPNPAAPALTPRAVSNGNIASPVSSTKSKPAPAPVRSNTTGITSSSQAANEEFSKWAKGVLGKGLNSNINVDDFVKNLLQLPAEPEILSEAVYANSPTLDGHRFAEEFIRRRKLADRGELDSSATAGFSQNNNDNKASSGGWSEVAKKGPANVPSQESGSNFKVVAAKKKGKR